MPWGAPDMPSHIQIPTFGAGRFTQSATGAWTPATINWSTVPSTPCRSFPVTEQSILSIWGEALKGDIGVWLAPSVVLPPQTQTSDSGAQTPVQLDGVLYMVVKVKDLGGMRKMKAALLRRFSHG